MRHLEAMLVIGMCFLSIMCSYTDLKRSIIPNGILLKGFVVIAIIKVIYVIASNGAYVIWTSINMLLADIIAILFYAAGLWAAGDAKLFCLLYLCVPGRILDAGSLSFSVIPFLFIFIPSLIWIAIDTIIQTIRLPSKLLDSVKMDLFVLRQRFYDSIIVVLEASVFYMVIVSLLRVFSQQEQLFISCLMMMYAFICNSFSVMRSKMIVVFHVLILCWLKVTFHVSIALPSVNNLVLVIVMLLFSIWANTYNYECIPVDKLRRGMILSSFSVLLLNKSSIKNLPVDASERMSARLTEQDVVQIKKWSKTKRGQKTITIVREIPFAVMISFGFISWTIIRYI